MPLFFHYTCCCPSLGPYRLSPLLLWGPFSWSLHFQLHFLLCICVFSCSVVSDSLQPHVLWPARLLCPWDSPGKNTGVGCHFLLQGIFWTQGSNPCFLHLQAGFFTTEPLGKPHTVYQDSFLLNVLHWIPAVYGSLSLNVSVWSTHFLSSDTNFISCLFLVSTLHLNYTQLLSCLLALILLAFDPLFLGTSLLPCLPTKLLFLPTDSES